ncbi:MAG: hypothetical protein NW206_02190 [Hyphomonadaceae bacterium]|nr:hypothetical protein [Hyphomonadaceae bacterium]
MIRTFAIAALLATAACSPPAQTDETPVPIEGVPRAAEAPADVLAMITAADASFIASEAIEDNTIGATIYRVKGTGAQGEITYNVMRQNEGWSVVETRRVLNWGDAPQAVRDVVATSPQAIVPDRVEEVVQPSSDAVMYDLFAGETLALTVNFAGGEAAIVPAPQ